MEIRKEIQGYPNYEVSNYGKVYNKKTGSEIKTNYCEPTGYYNLSLCNNGLRKTHMIHRIVLMTFIENKQNKEQVNHINGDKSDNRLDNLEWATRSENQKHAIRLGLRSAAGVKNSQAKLNDIIALEIFNSNLKGRMIARQYNISVSTVSQIKNGKIWTHTTKHRHPDLLLASDEFDNKKQVLDL